MKYPKNYLNYLKESMQKLSKINTNIDGINFQKKNRYFLLGKIKSLTDIDDSITKFTKKFEKGKKFKDLYKKISIKNINFHDYENQILNYCKDVLEKKIDNHQTNWIKNYQNLVCLGVIDKEHYTNDKKILKFFNKKKFIHMRKKIIRDFEANKRKNFYYKNGWIFYNNKTTQNIIKERLKNIINFNNFTFKNYYRIVKVIESIKQNGWITKKSWKPHGSVLYLFRKKYMILTGRHRLIALKYCYLNGYVKNIEIQFPILKGNIKIRNLNYNFKKK